MKRHRLRVVKTDAQELEKQGDALVCPRCKDRQFLVPISVFRRRKWVHIGDKCPGCGFEFNLKDAPN